jgi:beta-glucosidase/6-phospho-beta-glucosidase/beta-galactosidase
VGYAAAYQAVEPFHERGWLRPIEALAGKGYSWISFGAWDHAVRTGRVPFPAGVGRRIPGLRNSYDVLGVNYYMRVSIRLHPGVISNVKSGEFDAPPGIEKTGMGWQVYPPGFHDVVLRVAHTMTCPIYITENGCCEDGDELRRRYLLSHLSQLHRAIHDGADVRGYLHWCFADNFEWREGFAKRFGLVEMDYDDPALERHPRPSAHLLGAIAAANAISPELVEEYSPGALDRWG